MRVKISLKPPYTLQICIAPQEAPKGKLARTHTHIKMAMARMLLLVVAMAMCVLFYFYCVFCSIVQVQCAFYYM